MGLEQSPDTLCRTEFRLIKGMTKFVMIAVLFELTPWYGSGIFELIIVFLQVPTFINNEITLFDHSKRTTVSNTNQKKDLKIG